MQEKLGRFDPVLRAHYIWRLKRLVRLWREDYHNMNDAGKLLMERSLEATYWDCVGQGAAGEATGITEVIHRGGTS